MHMFILVTIFLLNAFTYASLTPREQDYVVDEVRSGNSSIIEQLSFENLSLQDAAVDSEKLMEMISAGYREVLADPRLALATCLPGKPGELGSAHCNSHTKSTRPDTTVVCLPGKPGESNPVHCNPRSESVRPDPAIVRLPGKL